METSVYWQLSHRADPKALPLADRHYNRQKPGTPQFVPPGRCIVLLKDGGDALWVTSWPFAEYTHHAWAGAWVNSLFRNESDVRASDLIREAVAITRYFYGDPPPLGMVTFIDTKKVKKKRVWGWCYRKAGFRLERERTKVKRLVAVRMHPEDMPPPMKPLEYVEQALLPFAA